MNETEEREITADELAEARRYSLLIAWSDEDQVYVVTVPELPGCVTHGETREEAAAMGEEAVATYLAGLRYIGRTVPGPRLAVVPS